MEILHFVQNDKMVIADRGAGLIKNCRYICFFLTTPSADADTPPHRGIELVVDDRCAG